jgi:ABC-type amino acid transport substrate-binding protein/GAF domain-containing protein
MMLKRGFCYLTIGLFMLILVTHRAAPVYSGEQSRDPGIELTAEEKDFLKGRQFRLGVDSARPPFEYINEQGVYSGISASFIQECAKRLDITIVPVPGLVVSTAVEKAKTGDIDIIPKITPTEERAKFVLFTQVYATFPSVIVSRKDARFIDGLNDLNGLKIGVLKGLVVQELLKRDFPNMPLIELSDVKSALIDLSNGKIDVFIDNLGTVSYNIEKIGLTNLKIAATTPYLHDLAFAVRKDMPLLKTALDKALADISDKDRNAIKNRWLKLEYKIGINWKLFGPILALLIAVLVFVIIWNRKLRLMAHEKAKIQQELKIYTEELESSSVLKSKIAKLSTDLQQATTFETLAHTFMSQCIPLIGVQYGLLYILDKERDLLVPVGFYGCAGNEDSKRPFALGQGLVGQCAFEMKSIVIRDTTGSGIFIEWGVGESAPKEVLISPLVQKNRAIGVLLLASVRAFICNGSKNLEELTSMIAMNIEILDRNLRTQSLLISTSEQAEKLRKQQEELRELSFKRDEDNKALQKQVEELARARRSMMNIMEDLEASRKETDERNLQTQKLMVEQKLQMEELEKFTKLTIDREGKMIELKEEINALMAQVGKEAKYKIVE